MKEHYEAECRAKLEQARQDALKEVGELLEKTYQGCFARVESGLRMTEIIQTLKQGRSLESGTSRG